MALSGVRKIEDTLADPQYPREVTVAGRWGSGAIKSVLGFVLIAAAAKVVVSKHQ
jgi:hypothetical protein